MIYFRNEVGEYTITDDFEVKGTHEKWTNIIKSFLELISYDFHPQSGDPFLILQSKLKKMGFEILKVTTTYDPEDTY